MRLSIAAAALIGLTASAAAQMLGPGMPVPGAPPPQQQQAPPCFQDFAPLRDEAQKRAGVLQAAIKRKAPREEICSLIKSFGVAEAKVVGFIDKNQQFCGIPPDAVKTMKANHQRTVASTSQVCAVGPTAGPRQTGPGLSDALGLSRTPTSVDTLAPKSGTMDTLTGNVLQR